MQVSNNKIQLKHNGNSIDEILSFVSRSDSETRTKAQTILHMMGLMKAQDKNHPALKLMTNDMQKQVGIGAEDTLTHLAEFALNNYSDEKLRAIATKFAVDKIDEDEANGKDMSKAKKMLNKAGIKPSKKPKKEEPVEPTTNEIKESHKGPKVSSTHKKTKVRGTETQVAALLANIINEYLGKNPKDSKVNNLMSLVAEDINMNEENAPLDMNCEIKSLNGRITITGGVNDVMNSIMHIMDAVEDDFNIPMLKARERYEKEFR